VAALCLTPGPSPGRTLDKITLPDQVKVSGQELKLVGMGRWRRFFKTLYVAGLYLPRSRKSATTALEADQARQIRIVFPAKGLTRQRFVDALNQGLFDNNKAETLKKLGPRIEKFFAFLARIKLKRPARLVLTYLPKKGTAVFFGPEKLGVIKGRDFMTALFAVWLGENPVSDGLKRCLLGQKK
jgi:hypothetical protein